MRKPSSIVVSSPVSVRVASEARLISQNGVPKEDSPVQTLVGKLAGH